MTKIIHDIAAWRNTFKKGSYGFVPTMGALHEGHLSLVRQSQKENKETVVSIFVNPTQFNDSDDYKNYPNTLEDDVQKLRHLGVNYIFLPSYEELYKDNYRFQIIENTVSKKLCGLSRTGHFDGVLSVVMKLLQIITPTRAYFGKKDYQQYILIRDMVDAFFLDVIIVGCETVRESDGLAMSSRNLLLSPQQRKIAPSLYKTISSVNDLEKAKQRLIEIGFQVDYLEEHWEHRLAAAFLGKIRLIDNVSLIGDKS